MFDLHLRQVIAETCEEQGEDPPDETYYNQILRRIGRSAAQWIGMGLESGVISRDGTCLRFSSAPDTGSQRWILLEPSNGGPTCDWDSLVEAACYVRLWKPCSEYGLEIKYKD
jgi:hypothetical protein